MQLNEWWYRDSWFIPINVRSKHWLVPFAAYSVNRVISTSTTAMMFATIRSYAAQPSTIIWPTNDRLVNSNIFSLSILCVSWREPASYAKGFLNFKWTNVRYETSINEYRKSKKKTIRRHRRRHSANHEWNEIELRNCVVSIVHRTNVCAMFCLFSWLFRANCGVWENTEWSSDWDCNQLITTQNTLTLDYSFSTISH